MARQSVPERNWVGASLLATITCHSKRINPPCDDRRRPEKCVPAELRFERAATILPVIDTSLLVEIPALFPVNENREDKVMEKRLSVAGEKSKNGRKSEARMLLLFHQIGTDIRRGFVCYGKIEKLISGV